MTDIHEQRANALHDRFREARRQYEAGAMSRQEFIRVRRTLGEAYADALELIAADTSRNATYRSLIQGLAEEVRAYLLSDL